MCITFVDLSVCLSVYVCLHACLSTFSTSCFFLIFTFLIVFFNQIFSSLDLVYLKMFFHRSINIQT